MRTINDAIKQEFKNCTTEDEIKNLYRKYSKVFHPDLGGNDTEMKRLNNLRDVAIKNLDKMNERRNRNNRQEKEEQQSYRNYYYYHSYNKEQLARKVEILEESYEDACEKLRYYQALYENECIKNETLKIKNLNLEMEINELKAEMIDNEIDNKLNENSKLGKALDNTLLVGFISLLVSLLLFL